jgi:putative ABC transport system permease protein
MITDTVSMALSAISRNKTRSVLTALGIVIGVASVIAMVHLGQSATLSVTQEISSMGSNLLVVQPGMHRGAPGGVRQAAPYFEDDDVDTLRSDIFGAYIAPVASSQATAVYGNSNYSTSITGSTNEYLQIRNWEVARGRKFEEDEIKSGAPVCLLGQTLVDNLYIGDQEPLGSSVRVGRVSCQVVGVLEKKGSSMGRDQDEVIIMPFKAVQRRLLGKFEVNSIYVSAKVDGDTDRIKSEIEAILRERRAIREGDDDDFHIRDMEELVQALQNTTGTLTALLGAIAAVSLLVGGIGIMNIMLVSVTERTREIGIRLAIGALARDVLLQFLVEAIVVSALGGLFGVVLGVGATWLITSKLGMPFALSPETILLSFSVSAAIGVLFGYIPARKAAKLNPIEALRHE